MTDARQRKNVVSMFEPLSPWAVQAALSDLARGCAVPVRTRAEARQIARNAPWPVKVDRGLMIWWVRRREIPTPTNPWWTDLLLGLLGFLAVGAWLGFALLVGWWRP